MQNLNWKNKNSYVKLAFVIGVFLFIVFYISSRNKVEEVPEISTSLDDWSLENSVLNGLPLVENKTIYQVDNPSDLDTIYITVFPTDTEDGLIDFSIFDLHEALNRSFNPTLYANVVFGDQNGNLSSLLDTTLINSTIRVRGNSARGAAFKSYRIEFTTENDNFKGFTVLNLNKHVLDPSKIANKFSFDIMSQLDNMASLRTNFVRIYIKDASLPSDQSKYVYYGLYTNIEQPNKDFLSSHGLDVNASLYKATSFEFREYDALKNVDDPNYDEAAFEEILEIREGNDHSKLIQMIQDINDMNIDFDESFNKYFNEENYLTWLAMNILLGHKDVLVHNFMLYNPTNSLTWYLLPWDYDKTFRFGEAGSSSLPSSLYGIQQLTAIRLHRRYFLTDENVEKLTQKMDELMATTFSKENVNNIIDDYIPVIEATLDKNPDVGLLRMEPNQIINYVRGFYGEIKNNYDGYISSLKYPTPVFTATPTKTLDGSTTFAWESSRDFEGDLVKYTLRLAKDPYMNQVVFSEENLVVPEYTYSGNLSGTYFLEVRSIDSDGNSQISLDTYKDLISNDFFYGIRQIVLE